MDRIVIKIGVDDRLALASVAEAMRLEIRLLMLMHKQQEVLSGSVESFCAYTRHRMDQMREIWRDAARPEQTFAPEKTTFQLPTKQAPNPLQRKPRKYLSGLAISSGCSTIQIAKSNPFAAIEIASAPPRQVRSRIGLSHQRAWTTKRQERIYLQGNVAMIRRGRMMALVCAILIKDILWLRGRLHR